VRISLFQMGLWMNATDLTIGLIAGRTPEPESRAARANPLWNSYRCKDNRWLYFVMIQGDRHWKDFCSALGQSQWLADPRFDSMSARAKNNAALIAEIDRVIGSRPLAEWAPLFDRHGLFWAPVQSEAEVLEDPQALALGAFATVDHPRVPACRVVASPVEFGGADPAYRAAPELGEHTEQVALEVGLSWAEIARLKEAGAIG
jgi:crotonobetainyl-CoA:carnitine CoA-transferase CaiB-like acyl-CoA transferase